MDPNMAAAFARILQDPNLVASLSQSASQPSPFPSNPVIPFPPPSFPPFCTQPPAPPAPSPSVPSKAKPSSRSGRCHRVSASLEPAVDPAVDPKKKMYYSTDEDIRLTLVESNSSQKEEEAAMKEYQQRLSDQRVEAANLNLLAAQEKKQCKLIDQKSKAMEMFTQLLQVDTSQMEEWAKNAHMKAVSNLSDQIWGKGESGQVS
uniref:No apical meristem-associated C-terminal domain-containing protein n=1 Tax=Oryza punctata TaxID=4537 RepID=A0A0E0KBT0_ORYPU